MLEFLSRAHMTLLYSPGSTLKDPFNNVTRATVGCGGSGGAVWLSVGEVQGNWSDWARLENAQKRSETVWRLDYVQKQSGPNPKSRTKLWGELCGRGSCGGSFEESCGVGEAVGVAWLCWGALETGKPKPKTPDPNPKPQIQNPKAKGQKSCSPFA